MTNAIIVVSKSPLGAETEPAMQVLQHLEETVDLYAELRRRVSELDVIAEAMEAVEAPAPTTVTAVITEIVRLLEAAHVMRR